MASIDERYQQAAMRFGRARASLRLPYVGKEARAISDSFAQCGLAIEDLRRKDAPLSEAARTHIEKLEELMDTSAIEDMKKQRTWEIEANGTSVTDPWVDVKQQGTWATKAELLLSQQDKDELQATVDWLASWANQKFGGAFLE